jgi:hypothetical protein
MGSMNALRFICAAWILPAGFSLIAFFGFFTNYTTDVFSRAGMAAQYDRSIFRYRVLGRWLVEAVSARFEQMSIAWQAPRALAVLDPAGNAATYSAYAFVHVVSTCIGCSLLLLVLRTQTRAIAAELLVVGISMLLAVSAFVVTPYDGPFFMWQMAALALTIGVAPQHALAPLAVVTVLAALTRETAYFIPVFVFAVHYRAILAGDRAARALLVVSSAAVVVTYAGLRLAMGWRGGSLYYAWQAGTNLKWTSLTGTAMLVAAVILLCGEGQNRRPRLCYAGLALPYILFVHVFAEPWEWRLWVPIIVPLTALLMVPERDRTSAA